jgi:hypothetical protein
MASENDDDGHEDEPGEIIASDTFPALAAEATVAPFPSSNWMDTTNDPELSIGADSTSRTVPSIGATAEDVSDVAEEREDVGRPEVTTTKTRSPGARPIGY